MDSFDAVFSPREEEGYSMRVMDKLAGTNDPIFHSQVLTQRRKNGRVRLIRVGVRRSSFTLGMNGDTYFC